MVLVAAARLQGRLPLAPRAAFAEGLFDFFFGGAPEQQARQAPPQASFFADPFGLNQPQPAPAPRIGRLRSRLLRAQLRRQVFSGHHARQRDAGADVPGVLPGERHQVFYGSHIDYASAADGERYSGSENAFAYRKALRADCTCNGRDPAGLAPVDLTLDGSLRPGDVIATTGGLVAYTGVKVGNGQAADSRRSPPIPA